MVTSDGGSRRKARKEGLEGLEIKLTADHLQSGQSGRTG
jgi:hypothetical protein